MYQAKNISEKHHIRTLYEFTPTRCHIISSCSELLDVSVTSTRFGLKLKALHKRSTAIRIRQTIAEKRNSGRTAWMFVTCHIQAWQTSGQVFFKTDEILASLWSCGLTLQQCRKKKTTTSRCQSSSQPDKIDNNNGVTICINLSLQMKFVLFRSCDNTRQKTASRATRKRTD